MKFWAFLKDSYREAVSGWVLPTMLILVGIFVFFVASMSFRALSFQEDMTFRLEMLQILMTHNDRSSGRPTFSLENFEQTNSEVDPWKGNYRFEIVSTYQSEEDFKRGQQSRVEPRSAFQWQMTLPLVVPYVKNLTVTQAEEPKAKANPNPIAEPKDGVKKPEAAKTLRFVATVRGTSIEDRKAWMHKVSLFFGALEIPLPMSQREWVYNFQTTLVNDFGAWIILLITVIVSAGTIPNTMRKGALDLLISKPVSRFQLLLYRYIGGLVFTFLIVAFMIGTVYLFIGIRFDFWSLNFLGMIPIISFYFAILYAISTFFGVLTRNMLVPILLVIVFWGIFSLVCWRNQAYHDAVYVQQKYQKKLQAVEEDDGSVDELAQGLGVVDPSGPLQIDLIAHYFHLIVPRTRDLDILSTRLVAEGVLTKDEMKKRYRNRAELPTWGSTIAVSSMFIALMLGLSYWRFVTRDG